MEALYLLIPLSLILIAFAVWIFFGAAESGQFEDLDGPALRILNDDDRGQSPVLLLKDSDPGGQPHGKISHGH